MSIHPPPSPLSALAASLTGPVVTLDPRGVVVGATPAARAALGCTKDELHGQRLLDFVRKPDESDPAADGLHALWTPDWPTDHGAASQSTIVQAVTTRGTCANSRAQWS